MLGLGSSVHSDILVGIVSDFGVVFCPKGSGMGGGREGGRKEHEGPPAFSCDHHLLL